MNLIIFSLNCIIYFKCNFFPEAVPNPVEDCIVSNETIDSAIIQCSAGFDGGLPQEFHVELYSSRGLVATSIEKYFPTFELSNLPSGTSLIAVVFAMNSRGRSNAVAFNVITKAKPKLNGMIFLNKYNIKVILVTWLFIYYEFFLYY